MPKQFVDILRAELFGNGHTQMRSVLIDLSFIIPYSSRNNYHIHPSKISYSKMKEMKWLVTAQQQQFRKYSCHKFSKVKTVLQLAGDFFLRICIVGMPPPYIICNYKCKVVLANNTERKLNALRKILQRCQFTAVTRVCRNCFKLRSNE